MALDIGAIRTALASQIATAVNSSTLPANVYDYPPDSPQLNAILVLPAAQDGNYVAHHGTFGTDALCLLGFRVEIRCGGGQVDAAKAMDLYLGTGSAASVIDAIQANPTLGGVVQDCFLSGATTPAWFQSGDAADTRTWLASSFDVQIRARR